MAYKPEQIDKILNYIIDNNEGGYGKHPNDPGGETKFGISKRSYPNLDIKNLTREQAMEIYKKDFVPHLPEGINDDAVLYHVLDASINSGPGVIKKIYTPGMSATDVQKKRMEHYQSLPGWSNSDFQKAWTNRTKNQYAPAETKADASTIEEAPVETTTKTPATAPTPTVTKTIKTIPPMVAPTAPTKQTSYRLSDLMKDATGKETFGREDVKTVAQQAGFEGSRLNKLLKGFDQAKGKDLIFASDGSTFQTEDVATKNLAGKTTKDTGNKKGFDTADLIGLGRNVNLLGGIGSSLIQKYEQKRADDYAAQKAAYDAAQQEEPKQDKTTPAPVAELPASPPVEQSAYDKALTELSGMYEGKIKPPDSTTKWRPETSQAPDLNDFIKAENDKVQVSPLDRGFHWMFQQKGLTDFSPERGITSRIFGRDEERLNSLLARYEQDKKEGIPTSATPEYFEDLNKRTPRVMGDPGVGMGLIGGAVKAPAMDLSKATNLFNSTTEQLAAAGKKYVPKLLAQGKEAVSEVIPLADEAAITTQKLLQQGAKRLGPGAKRLGEGMKRIGTWGEDVKDIISNFYKTHKPKFEGGGLFGDDLLTGQKSVKLNNLNDFTTQGLIQNQQFSNIKTPSFAPLSIPKTPGDMRAAGQTETDRNAVGPGGGGFDSSKLGVAGDAVKYGLPFIGTAIGMKHLKNAGANAKFTPAQLMRTPAMAMQKPNIARPSQQPSTGDVQYDAMRQHATSMGLAGQEAAYNEANQNSINQQRMQDAQLVNQNNMFNAQGMNQNATFNAQKNLQLGAMKSQLSQEPWVATQHMLAGDRAQAAQMQADQRNKIIEAALRSGQTLTEDSLNSFWGKEKPKIQFVPPTKSKGGKLMRLDFTI